MKNSLPLLLSLLVLHSNFVAIWPSTALPLYTNSRWIVDEGGRRVKLACVNWASHLEVMAAEGLNKQPLDAISKRIAAMGFNCVRLTWPLFMVTNGTLGSVSFRKSLQNFGLVESVAGVLANNPGLVDLPVLQVFQVKPILSTFPFQSADPVVQEIDSNRRGLAKGAELLDLIPPRVEF